jgi:hypothetical protein
MKGRFSPGQGGKRAGDGEALAAAAESVTLALARRDSTAVRLGTAAT